MKRTRLAVAAILAFAFTSPILSRAQPGSLDITFNPGTGANGVVTCIAVQTNGQILIGGVFNMVNGVSRNRVARLSADGALDDDFFVGTGPDSGVYALAVEPDGKILIGGDFSSVNVSIRRSFTRLRADGSLDSSFPILNCDGPVRQLQRQMDGRIVIIGGFTIIGGIARRNVARLTTAYTVDSTFNPAVGNTNGMINALVIQTNGSVILGGTFKALSGTSRDYVARVSSAGVVDPSFDAGFIDGSSVTAIALQSDGKVILAGSFWSINGYSRINIARLNQDGSVDTSFVTPFGVSPYAGYGVGSISIQSDGKILLSGGFTTVSATSRNAIARLNSNGAVDVGFADPMTSYLPSIDAHVLQSDGRILIGGEFPSVSGTNINRIARLNNNFSLPVGVQFLTANQYFGTFLNGTVSNTYRVEWTTDLNTPSLWTPLLNVTLQTNPQFIVDPTPATGARFYRAVQLSP